MRKDPFHKPVKAYRTLGEAFRDADYANAFEFHQKEEISCGKVLLFLFTVSFLLAYFLN